MLVRVTRHIALAAPLVACIFGCQKSKPEEVAPLVQPTSAPVTQVSVQASPPPAPTLPPLASSIAVDNKAVGAQFISGVGLPAEGLWTWTLGNSFAVELGVPPDAKQKGGKLSAKLSIHDNMIKQNHSLTITPRIGETDLTPQTYSKGGLTEYAATVPATALQSDRVRIEFKLDKTFKPGKDELGVMLFGVTLSPSE